MIEILRSIQLRVRGHLDINELQKLTQSNLDLVDGLDDPLLGLVDLLVASFDGRVRAVAALVLERDLCVLQLV